MSDGQFLKIVGVILVLMGIFSAWVGDRELPKKGPFSLPGKSWPPGMMRWFKWVFAAAFIYAGAELILRH